MPTNKLYGNNNDSYHGSLDVSSTRDGVQPYWGNGNTVDNYDVFVNHAKNIELGLKVHEYRGADVAQQSDGTYDVAAGASPFNANRASWNFDFSVNTGVEGGHKTLADYDFRIIISSSDAGETAVFDLQHLAAGITPWVNDPVTGGFDDEDGANPQVSQNSVNLGFGFLKAIFGTDYADAGEHYTVRLEAYEGHKLIGAVEQHIDVVAPV